MHAFNHILALVRKKYSSQKTTGKGALDIEIKTTELQIQDLETNELDNDINGPSDLGTLHNQYRALLGQHSTRCIQRAKLK